MADKKTTGEKILDTLEKFSPERLDKKIMDKLDKLSVEAANEPMTERQRGIMETSEKWLIASIILVFIWMMYIIFF